MKDNNIAIAILIAVVALLVLMYVKKYKDYQKIKNKLERLDILNTSFLDAYTDLIYVKDEKLKYLLINHAVELFYNKTADEIIGKNDFEITSKEIAQKTIESDLTVLEKGIRITFEEECAGKIYRITKFPIKITNEKNGIGSYIEDITKEREIELEKLAVQEKFEYLSYHDALTGLYNIRFLEEEIKRLDTKRNLPFSIIEADANGLKLTNDIFGHAYGDAFIKKAANVIKRVCRADDIIARSGGDEFIILLPKTGYEEAEQIIDRIKKELSKESINFIKGSISMGAATKLQIEENIFEILNIAEERMYQTKVIEKTEMQKNAYELMIRTLHEISPEEKRHADNVSYLSELMGRKLKLPENDIKNLVTAGYLHDIGKVVLNSSFIDEDTKMNSKESAEMKKHAVYGYRILNAFQKLYGISEAVLYHHENWDGTGYPKGIKGEHIPLKSRIISIADKYDRIIYDTIQGEILSREELLSILRKHAGTLFDPDLTEIFAQMIETDTITI